MARSRNLKPALFKNEVLGTADPLITLLFEGLWLLCDRDGRMEDRVLRIKGELFPYRDGVDVDGMLSWLHDNGFVTRYQVGGSKYILINKFVEHQNPHKNETPSVIPAPESSGQNRKPDRRKRTDSGKNQSAPEKIGIAPAESLLLNPESPSLNPDPLHPDSVGGASASPEQFRGKWNEAAVEAGWPKCEKMTPDRTTALRARLGDREWASRWPEALEAAKASPFLRGENDTGWRANVDWFLKQGSLTKILEGKYQSRASPARRSGPKDRDAELLSQIREAAPETSP